MQFNSLTYFMFLPVVYLLFYLARERMRWCVLLAASLVFYAALGSPYLLLALALVSLSSYAFGIRLGRAETVKKRRTLFWSGIAANVSLLASMKYLPFVSERIGALANLLSPDISFQPVRTLVIVGVSYYVFQAISYLIDIYLGTEQPEHHLGYFVLYLAFFPKLLQGPIERAGDLLPQLKANYKFDYDNMRFGMLLFTWGLFKKVLIADRLALFVDPVYNDVHAFTGLPLLFATYAYALQIYLDFSGYTDMALGTARLFNVTLTQNFNNPYLATSVADFWRRWHISFSRWILDYIFRPLQFQWRSWKKLGTASALIVTFLLSGIWHGATWGLVIWGCLHGVFMTVSVFFAPYQRKLHEVLGVKGSSMLQAWQVFATFNLTCFAWVFFRAATVQDAGYVVISFYKGIGNMHAIIGENKAHLLVLIVSLSVLMLVEAKGWLKNSGEVFFKKPLLIRWSGYLVFILYILLFNFMTDRNFIYTQF